jgi:hypothetical protein
MLRMGWWMPRGGERYLLDGAPSPAPREPRRSERGPGAARLQGLVDARRAAQLAALARARRVRGRQRTLAEEYIAQLRWSEPGRTARDELQGP